MGYAQRANKVAIDHKAGLVPSFDKAKERLNYYLLNHNYQTAYEEGLITLNKLNELKTAYRHNRK